MYKKILIVVMIVSITLMIFGTAVTPLNSNEGKQNPVQLVGVKYQFEKGVVLKFHINGNINNNKLKGFIMVNGKSLTLYCPRKDPDGTVLCTAQKATAQLAGKKAYAVFVGFTFSFIIPKRPR